MAEAKIDIRLVDPMEARKGQHMKSFDPGQMVELANYIIETQKAMRRLDVKHELVYTMITSAFGGKSWQVFLLP